MNKEIIIQADKVDRHYLRDLFRFSDLFLLFAARDILVRYRQAFFGIAWAIGRPLLTMSVFALIFGKIAHLPSQGVNYSLFVLAGMLPWQLFANTTQEGCMCLLNNAGLIGKAYFPRLLLPASQIMVHLVDYGVSFSLLFILLLFSSEQLSYQLLFLPVFLILLVALCLGMSFWFSALTVNYRDFKILIPFGLQFGMFLSPVGYGTFIIPEQYQYFYFLNPLVGIIDGMRWSLFGISYPLLSVSIALSCIISLLLLVSGFCYFRKMERSLADKL